MTIIKARYATIGPTADYITDPVILAQSWKKSHQYIRRHNWYADTLSLDCSAVDLDTHLATWSSDLQLHKFRAAALRMVPAPKSHPWAFAKTNIDGWGPRSPPNPVMRPLAHLGIREQTITTAVMLCLANCIETAQGDSTQVATMGTPNSVYSYGNRLHCHWQSAPQGRRAHFSWGNSETYSRYFKDYQSFIERPAMVARDAVREDLGPVYILKLDLAGFYDNIHLDTLILRLRAEYEAYQKHFNDVPQSDEQFWTIARQALTFEWDARDTQLQDFPLGDRLIS